MSKYLRETKRTKRTNNAVSTPALARARRNVFWQAGLAVLTVVLTIVIIFAMTSAWYTNIVQTSGLVFEAEAWGFDGQITIAEQAIQAAPGDEGNIQLEVVNSSESMTSVGISASKSQMAEEMQKRLFFYVETQSARNGETMDRVYLNSTSSYTYTLFSQGKLSLTEKTHNDAPVKWQWVYDMLGYYVLGTMIDGNTFYATEYLRPVEYDYDKATFDYVTDGEGRVNIELKTVDGVTTVEEFLAQLSKTDGYANDISSTPVNGYYPVEVDEYGYGVYVYLCSYSDVEMATRYDTALGQQAAAKDDENPMPTYPVTLTVSAQKNDEDVYFVTTLAQLNSAMSLFEGGTIQLTENITLTDDEKIIIPTGAKLIVDLNGKKIEAAERAVEAQPGSSVIFLNGEIVGSGEAEGIYTVGAEVTLNKVEISGFVDAISVGDHTGGNTLDSKVRIVDCELSGIDSAVYISGNGLASAQKTQLIVERSTMRSDAMVIWGNGDASGNGRWGTDIQIIDSTLLSNTENEGAAIFHPQKDSILTIHNSTLSGYTGIAIKGGTISIQASQISGTGAGADIDEETGNPVVSPSGFADTGDAIYIEANYGYEIRLEIDGANILDGEYVTSTVTSTHRKSLRIWEDDAANVSVKVSAGIFDEELPDQYIASGSEQTALTEGGYEVKKSST